MRRLDLAGETGVGAIHIRGEASMDAHARIYTETTCGAFPGTVNQSVPAVLLEGWRNGSPAYVHGARSNANIRTNYGIVNMGAQPRAFRVIVNSVGGKVEDASDAGDDLGQLRGARDRRLVARGGRGDAVRAGVEAGALFPQAEDIAIEYRRGEYRSTPRILLLSGGGI